MKTLLHNVLIIGGAAIVVLFFISLVLSRRIIRPLEENDKQQKQFISDLPNQVQNPSPQQIRTAALIELPFLSFYGKILV